MLNTFKLIIQLFIQIIMELSIDICYSIVTIIQQNFHFFSNLILYIYQ